MPCTSVFDRQDAAWRAEVLPKGLPRVAVEAGVAQGWRRWVGDAGRVLALDHFGASAPAETVFEQLGLTAGHVFATAKALLNDRA